MYIKEILGTFGMLGGAKLSLSRGLNVITGRNESGKSTWCALLRALLYGLPSNERDKIGYLAEKNKYAPFDGSAMEGRLTLEFSGREIVISRAGGKGGGMANFTAVYGDTGEAVPGFFSDNVGEMICGMDRDCFERSAFVRQLGVSVDKSASFEKRIQSLAATGQEQVSYSDVDEQLGKWQRERKFNRSGKIPLIEDELTRLNEDLTAARSLAVKTLTSHARLTALEDELYDCEAELAYHLATTAKAELEKLSAARMRAKVAALNYENAAKNINFNGFIPDIDYINGLRESGNLARACAAAAESTEGIYSELKARVEEDEAELSKYSFLAGGADEVYGAAQDDFEVARKLSHKKVFWLPFFLAFISAGAAAASRYFTFAPELIYIPAGMFGISLLWIGISFFGVRSGKKKAKELCEKYKAEQPETIMSVASAYAFARRRLDGDLESRETAARDMDSATTAYNTSIAALSEKLRLIGKMHTPLDGVGTLASDLFERRERFVSAKAAFSEAEALLSMLQSSVDEKALTEAAAAMPVNLPPLKWQSAKAAEEGREKSLSEISKTLEEYAHVCGQLSHYGDIPSIENAIAEKTEKKDRLTQEYESLALARQVLKNAYSEISSRISPVVNRRASEIYFRLTGGKYDRVVVRQSFEALAGTDSDMALRSILFLSAGASDQLYLAIRLALLDVVFSGCGAPLILDDAFANFDSGRMALALDVILEFARERQVILFSCHDREESYLKDREEVNLVRL